MEESPPVSRAPVIGIPAAIAPPSEAGYVYQQAGHPYVRAILESGGVPVILPISHSPQVATRLLELVDGIVLQGGGDICPSFYGQDRSPHVLRVDPETDQFEMELCRRCIDLQIPQLAICRGIQILNVAMGGTLIQDLPSEKKSTIAHRQPPPRDTPTHAIDVDPRSRLASVLGEIRLSVNSFHHQAVDRLGRGLRVTARSADGVIEAIEAPGPTFVVGVQFHPEETLRTVPSTALLFKELVGAARESADRRGDHT